MMEAEGASETSTRFHDPEHQNINFHCHKKTEILSRNVLFGVQECVRDHKQVQTLCTKIRTVLMNTRVRWS